MTTALITGANKGIGREIARELGRRGLTVWLGCRDVARGEQAARELRAEGLAANAVALDVTDADSVGAAAARLSELDVLVNNAGINLRPPDGPSGESVDDIRATFEVNVLGPIRVTQAFLPLLRRSAEPRIVMMSSGLGSLAETIDLRSENWNVGQAGYCASKAALNMVTLKFAKELLAEGFKVNAADPGLTATDLTAGIGQPVQQAAAAAVELATTGPYGPTAGFFRAGLAPYRF
jgi:NAD(P)-dependent dehydrogenase (short-subunit alcohol dehydrogenase family)